MSETFNAEFWQDIIDNSIHAYERIYEYFRNINEKGFKHYKFTHEIMNQVIKDICYCDLEYFFDKQGIIISNTTKWFIIYDEGYNVLCKSNFIETLFLNNRFGIKHHAVKKAFEILENIINYGEMNDK